MEPLRCQVGKRSCCKQLGQEGFLRRCPGAGPESKQRLKERQGKKGAALWNGDDGTEIGVAGD